MRKQHAKHNNLHNVKIVIQYRYIISLPTERTRTMTAKRKVFGKTLTKAFAAVCAIMVIFTQAASAVVVSDKAWVKTPSVTGGSCINVKTDSEEIPAGCRQVHATLYKDGWVYAAGAIDTVKDFSGSSAVTKTGFMNMFRYNPVTGAVDSSFKPQFYTDTLDFTKLELGLVRSIANGPGDSIYIAGDFVYARDSQTATPINAKGLIKLNTSTATFDTTFRPNVGCRGATGNPCKNYVVKYLASRNLVLIGGEIVRLNGVANTGFGIVDGTNGKTPLNMSVTLGGALRPIDTQARITYVRAIAVNPNNDSEFFVAGEFSELGVNKPWQAYRYGMFKLQIDANGVLFGPSWNALDALSASRPDGSLATRSTPLPGKCSKNRTWVRQLEYSPDGNYITVVSSAGGVRDVYPALCDAFVTFNAQPTLPNGVYDQRIKPVLYNRTPVDTVLSVCYLDNTAYVGGHFRLFNTIVYTNGVLTSYIPYFKATTSPATTPVFSQAQPNAHYGLAAIDTNVSSATYGKALENWNKTLLDPNTSIANIYVPWSPLPETVTGRGNGWAAATCIPASSSPTGKPIVIMGGDAPTINGDTRRSKLGQFTTP